MLRLDCLVPKMICPLPRKKLANGCDILIFVGSITSITADLGSLTDQQTNLRLIELDQLPISPQRAA
jgi:hypothetical protein